MVTNPETSILPDADNGVIAFSKGRALEPQKITLKRAVDMRYVGQEHAVTVDLPLKVFERADRVAIKRMHAGGDDPAARRRSMLKEARRASQINDPHVAGIHDVIDGETDVSSSHVPAAMPARYTGS